MNPTQRRRLAALELATVPAGPDVIRVEAPGGPAFEMRRQSDGSWQHVEVVTTARA